MEENTIQQSLPLSDSTTHYLLFVGTYTNRSSDGIYVFQFNEDNGSLRSLGLAAQAVNPSALTLITKDHHHTGMNGLLAVQETRKATDGLPGAVVSYAIDNASGQLKMIDQAPSHGDGPCSIALDDTGQYVFIANFWGGALTVLPIQEDLRFAAATAIIETMDRSSQIEAKPHAFCMTPDCRFVVVAELGSNRILTYHFDKKTGRIEVPPADIYSMKPQSGPRHLTFSMSGDTLYVINEIACTVTVLSVKRDTGMLQFIQEISTLGNGMSLPGDAAEIFLHPNGRFLYTSTRQTSTIRLFSISGEEERLTFIRDFMSGGDSPAVFTISPSGRWIIVGNQASCNLAVFPIDLPTGLLGTLHSTISVDSPSSLIFYQQNQERTLDLVQNPGQDDRFASRYLEHPSSICVFDNKTSTPLHLTRNEDSE